MATDKLVPAHGRPFVWASYHAWANVRCPVEVAAAQVGEVIFVSSLEVPQYWGFNLTHHGERVYRLDVRPAGNHPNPVNRPEGFPRKVPECVHEHIYVEGLDLECARPLEDQTVVDHAQMLGVFCANARVTFAPLYQPPPFVQPRLGPA